jgi:NAD+ synthase (glutamine-hydrolysing)
MSSGQYVTVATCNLNQWAMDFDGNMERILESCVRAKKAGATYRLGPELEIPGYGCEDHFYELDTIHHSWESLVKLLEQGATDDLLCDFGMPVLHRGVRYNCRVLALNKKILLIRPKLALADDGNYRESRWFTAFRASRKSAVNEEFVLPPLFQDNFGQHSAPFGIHSIQFLQDGGLSVGCESCEELWTPNATHIELVRTAFIRQLQSLTRRSRLHPSLGPSWGRHYRQR